MGGVEAERSQADALRPAVTKLRIVVLALSMGVLTFGGMALYLQQNADLGNFAGLEFLATLAIAAAAIMLIVSWIVPAKIAADARRQIAAGQYDLPDHLPADWLSGPLARLTLPADAVKLTAVYVSKTIVTAALLE